MQKIAQVVACSAYVEQATATGCHKKPMYNPPLNCYDDSDVEQTYGLESLNSSLGFTPFTPPGKTDDVIREKINQRQCEYANREASYRRVFPSLGRKTS